MQEVYSKNRCPLFGSARAVAEFLQRSAKSSSTSRSSSAPTAIQIVEAKREARLGRLPHPGLKAYELPDVAGHDVLVVRCRPKRPSKRTQRSAQRCETSSRPDRTGRPRTDRDVGAIKEPRPWQAATRLAYGERGDERAIRRRVLLHQALKGFRHPMDGIGWQYPKSVCQLLVGNPDSVGLRSIISLGGWQIVFDSWRPGSCVRPGLLCR